MDPAALKQLLERHSAQIDQLHKRNEALQIQVTRLLASTNSSETRRPRPVLPNPETFNGNKWETWQVYARAKVDVDGEAIGNDKAQFWFLYGCLDAKIQAMVFPLAMTSTSPTADAILEALARVYDDPNRASKAADRLTGGKIKQFSDESFSAYLARYEKTLYEAGAQDWPDLVKISTVRGGLGDVLKKKLEVQLVIPAEYDPFVKALHQLAQSPSRGPAPSGPVKEGFKGNSYGGTKIEVDAVNIGSLDCSYESGDGKDNEEDFAEAFGYLLNDDGDTAWRPGLFQPGGSVTALA